MIKRTLLRWTLGTVLFSLLLVGCATFPTPRSGQGTLVVGSIGLTAKGYDRFGGATVNGDHQTGVEVTLQNVDTGDVVKLVAGDSGFFYSASVVPGPYRLKKLYYKNTVDRSYADVFTNLSEGTRFFQISPDKVNNLGEITWTSDSEDGNRYWVNQGYDHTKELLERADTAKAWNAVPIESVTWKK